MKPASASNNGVHPATGQSSREYLELWIRLSRRKWGSLVLVPADSGGSTAEIANALAEIGQRLSYGPVTAITVTSLEYGSAMALADLQQHLDRERRARSGPLSSAPPSEEEQARAEIAPAVSAAARPPAAPAPAAPTAATAAKPVLEASPEEARPSEALVRVPPARLIISIPPVVSEPLGLTAAHESDAVVLAVRMNHSLIGEVRRTLELVGRERIIGCLLVR